MLTAVFTNSAGSMLRLTLLSVTAEIEKKKMHAAKRAAHLRSLKLPRLLAIGILDELLQFCRGWPFCLGFCFSSKPQFHRTCMNIICRASRELASFSPKPSFMTAGDLSSSNSPESLKHHRFTRSHTFRNACQQLFHHPPCASPVSITSPAIRYTASL